MPYGITDADDESSDPSPEFVIRLKGKNYDRCQIQFTIINTGDRLVHIDKVEFPDMGPREGAWIFKVADSDDPIGASESAFVDVDSDLEGSESVDVLANLQLRAEMVAILGRGDTTTMARLPLVHLSYRAVPKKIAGGIAIAVTG